MTEPNDPFPRPLKKRRRNLPRLLRNFPYFLGKDRSIVQIFRDNKEEGTELTGRRVIRSGSWHSKPIYRRSANRYHFTPDFVISYLGLRLACPASAELSPETQSPDDQVIED